MSASLPRLSRLRLPFGKLSFPARFNGTGAAGPRRLFAAIGIGAAVVAMLVGLTLRGTTQQPLSHPGRLPKADPLPGGPNSNPYLDALAMRSNQEAAAKQQEAGQSYTPQIAPSQSYADKPHKTHALLTSPPPPPAAAKVAATPPPPAAATQRTAAAPAAQADQADQAPKVVQVASPQGGQAQARTDTPEDLRYKAAIDRMMGGWGPRLPRTDVILPPDPTDREDDNRSRGGSRSAGQGGAEVAPATASPASAGSDRANRQRTLIPSGRGVYAHTVLAASSDQNSPVVLEADSGPIAHARLIGSFAREDERLVIRVSKMTYNGQQVGLDGIVVAPGTMEAGVASGVDQHYLARFALPAAAAFVSGLGQAFAQSNSTVVASPFGGATAFQRLNLGQQLGVGAGAAGARVGQALDQAAPRGPTVRLDVGSSVGVMFLSDVTVPE